jgi:hypothetical protein
MGQLERLHEYISAADLEKIRRELRQEWDRYKRSRLYGHGEETKENGLDMILLYLIKKGIL